MKVIYTHDIFSSQAYGGITRYFSELIHGMPATGAKVEVLAGLHISGALNAKQYPGASLRGIKVPALPHMRFLRHWANNAFERAVARAEHDTILHHTYYFRLPRIKGTKLVITIHDMIHELFPDCFDSNDPTSAMKRQACERADRIIAVSESTRRDLIRCFNIPAEKISVIHHGLTTFAALPPAKWPSRYFLFVGSRFGYKNFDALLRAYAASKAFQEGTQLVCYGGGDFESRETKLIAQLGLEAKVHQQSGNDDRLAAFYRGAVALVYPSRYEGFGMPALEAMGAGCPVACANASSLPEVVGEAAELFDPASLQSMTAALDLLHSNPGRREELSRRGRARAANFSWERAVRETLAAYQSCFSESPGAHAKAD